MTMMLLCFTSLTLNKLRQKRMIEEKIAQRRALQMEKLQLKQHKEKEVHVILFCFETKKKYSGCLNIIEHVYWIYKYFPPGHVSQKNIGLIVSYLEYNFHR